MGMCSGCFTSTHSPSLTAAGTVVSLCGWLHSAFHVLTLVWSPMLASSAWLINCVWSSVKTGFALEVTLRKSGVGSR